MSIRDKANMHKRIEEITGKKMFSLVGGMKEGMLMIEKEKYLKDGANTLENSSMTKEENLQYTNMEGPETLKSEVKSALPLLNSLKAAWPDEIVIEMLDDFNKITEIINVIHDSGDLMERP